jgi:glycerol kinase
VTPLILAIDQGTSATKCVLMDAAGRVVARASAPIGEMRPQPGWVEQDPEEIWRSVQDAVRDCIGACDPAAIRGVGLSTQRESVVLWDRQSGRSVAPLVSWQDQRTSALCDGLRDASTEALVRARTGLPLDPMFSAAKASWLLDRHDPDRSAARAGRLCLGTIDAWLLHRLTGQHATEPGNASRTQLLNVHRCAWDDDLLTLFRVPRAALPELRPSRGMFGVARGIAALPGEVPVCAVMGDSHAALYAHGAERAGQVKATYGTGSSVMGLIDGAEELGEGLCLTIAWQEDEVRLAAEGNIRATGAALRWTADLLGLSPEALAELGLASESNGAVLVPGFNGLGAPWWDDRAVGLITNLSLGTDRGALARAALEAIVHQVADVVAAVAAHGPVEALHVDGGPSRNDGLMQMQANLLGCPVLRGAEAELSAVGVAHMAGQAAGIWTREEWRALPRECRVFAPRVAEASQAARRSWLDAVARARFRPPTP